MRVSKSTSKCFIALILMLSAVFSAEALYTYTVNNVTKTTDRNLTVHVIAHTHDDTGWLKTVDEYYRGANNKDFWAGVQYILDSVTEELDLYPQRRFIFVEMAFFSRWWREQDNATKLRVQAEVADGRLEFIGGGWSMHDEATSYYEDQIDNMAVGHQFISENFNGTTPSIGWQIDAFGHSATTASLYAQMGFDGMWFARADMQDKDKRMNEKTMEMIWQPTTSQGKASQIFAAINYAHYSAPGGFCFDINFCQDEPIADDPDLEYYNVDRRVQQITDYFRGMSDHYQSDQLLHTWGDDFHFMAAASYFKNLDKLIKGANDRFSTHGVNMVYSTPSQYLKAVNKQNLTFPVKTDDFFPLRDSIDNFWTGFYTSRVAQKGYTRDSGRLFQNIRRLVSQQLIQGNSTYLQQNIATVVKALGLAEQNRGLIHHHDAITGTSRQYVSDNYVMLMDREMTNVHNVVTNPLFKEITLSKLGVDTNFTACLTNTTADACQVIQGLANKQSVLVAIYNPLSNARNQLVRLKVPSANVQAYLMRTKDDKTLLVTDVICANKTSPTDCDLFFSDHFEGTAMNHYLLVPTTQSNHALRSNALNKHEPLRVVKISENRSITVVRDLTTFVLKEGIKSYPFKLKFNYYPSKGESNAYIFRPQDQAASGSLPYSSMGAAEVFNGKVITQVNLYGDSVTVVMRFENNGSSLPGMELETFIDSINVQDGNGKEVVVLIDSDINNNQTWYTDANGLDMQQRNFNFRPTWNFSSNCASSGNYYPVNSAVYIQDNATGLRMTFATDRPHGATSLKNGQIEVMLHRRLVAPAGMILLNETDWDGNGLRQWFRHRLIFSNTSDDQRTTQFHLDQPNIVLLAPYQQQSFLDRALSLINSLFTPKKAARKVDVSIEILKAVPLPDNVKVVYKPYSTTEYVIWLHNLNEKNVTVTLNTLFRNQQSDLSRVDELSLSANQFKSDMLAKKLVWNGGAKLSEEAINSVGTDINVDLRPLEIRVFRYTITG